MNTSATPTNSEAAILARVIEPEKDDLGPELAHYLLAMDFASEDIHRMNELAERARSGLLTEQEQVELENYHDVGHLLALMQSKARNSLKRASGLAT